jgi:glycolate oxidase FAD binding subunit
MQSAAPIPSVQPCDEAEIAAALRDFAGGLVIRGGGSKMAFGAPFDAGSAWLDTGALSGITLYEPEELVLTARAGTPIAEIAQVVAQRGQHLAFEPPAFGALFGSDGVSTLGGMVASGWSGPRRIKAGAVRDHVLGMRAVGGDGEIFKSGGRVVKNVTGFDLPKLLTGSHGTLAVMTEITIKVMPAPEQVTTLMVPGMSAAQAVALFTTLLGGPFEVSGAAYLPEQAALRSGIAALAQAGTSAALIRLEGFGPSVADRAAAIAKILDGGHEAVTLDRADSDAAWAAVRDVARLLDPGRIVWRLSLPATDAAAVIARISAVLSVEAYLDWGGNLVWLSLPHAADGHAAVVRGALSSGHATLMRAPDAVRRRTPAFQPVIGPLAGLAERVKSAFDPAGVLPRLAPL